MRKGWLLIGVLAICLLLWLILELPDSEMDPIQTGRLGMVMIDIADEKAADSYHVDELGVYVLAVDEKSRAYQAGVRSGDRLVNMNGLAVKSTGEFMALQEQLTPRQRIVFDFQRGAEAHPMQIELIWIDAP